MSRDELVVVVRRQAGQIIAMAGRLVELMEANEALVGKLARLEHLLSRNSGNSRSRRRKTMTQAGCHRRPSAAAGGAKRSRGKQPGAPRITSGLD
ncbi:MAG: hypothetical protein M3Z25_04915 [Actinomycetota bacterium]|nr:hypothetical protein [Actinomycetota bacterium]